MARTMAERMATIEEKLWQNDKDHSKLYDISEKTFNKLDQFILSVTKEYVRKEELEEFRKQIKTWNKTKAEIRKEWIKTRWTIAVAIIWFVWMYLKS